MNLWTQFDSTDTLLVVDEIISSSSLKFKIAFLSQYLREAPPPFFLAGGNVVQSNGMSGSLDGLDGGSGFDMGHGLSPCPSSIVPFPAAIW